MTKEEKELLLKSLCETAQYGVKGLALGKKTDTIKTICLSEYPFVVTNGGLSCHVSEQFKPYLRPMSSMTEEEAREITKLSGILTGSENILSISVKEEFIDIKIDDGVCSTETRTLWFTEMPTSITQLDYLNDHHFDYRGLIDKGLALSTEEFNPYKD